MMHQNQFNLADQYLHSSRPQQQSSPSDNSLTFSSSTPPHQLNSRASPASTALVMSSNNINGQSVSRQLTPSTSSPHSSNGANSAGSSPPVAHHQHQHASHHPHQHHQQQIPPNPMARQFACHAKSMSAGVEVSVPGISNNLATMNRNNNHNNNNNNNTTNNNNNINTSNNNHLMSHRNSHHRALPVDPVMNGHSHPHHQLGQHHATQRHLTNSHSARSNENNTLSQTHQVIKEHQTLRNQHHRQQSHPNFNNNNNNNHNSNNQFSGSSSAHIHQQRASGNLNHNMQQVHQFDIDHHHSGSTNNFTDPRQAVSSSIINNIHTRSASARSSNILLAQAQHTNHLTNSQNYPSHITTNSVWSIDENISKSQGKLTSSGYIPHPSIFNSITDMSCDNVSNPSRLVDAPQAPGYYLHPSTTVPTSSARQTDKSPEFLPICDLMFNLISMIIYFCENTFGIIALIALYYHTAFGSWALIGAAFVLASNSICQYLSFNWLYKTKLDENQRKREAREELKDEEGCERRFYNGIGSNMQNHQYGSCNWLPHSGTELQLKFLLVVALEAVLHIACLGFLLRYIKLVIPVKDTTRIKREARDLCMLRMIHGFIQSVPLIILQAHIVCSQTSAASITNLSIISVILSLINVCWALASFTKYARKKYMHKFVLTWLGIISQLLWRLGTVSSRVVALTIYGVYYGYWMLVILALHWLTMFFWLIKPGNLLRDEMNLTGGRKGLLAMAVAWIYCFCYVNFEEHNSKLKMTSYYLIMFLENNLLLTVCLIFSSNVNWFKNLAILVVYLGFLVGIMFMLIYYKYLHVNLLINELSCSQESVDSIADQLTPAGKKIAGFKTGTICLKSEDTFSSGHRYNNNINATIRTGSHTEISRAIKPPYLPQQMYPPPSGLFNYKSNPRIKTQKTQGPHSCRQNNCS